jgi:AcrR family transcriptional regulator
VREQQMLEAAERAFAERGFHGASVDAIAAASGITKPMVYAYFGSKEGLYRACMQRARARLLATLRDGVDTSAAPDQQLWHGLLAFFTFVERERDSWAILLGEVTQGTGPFAPEGAAVRRELSSLIAELLRRAAAAEGLGAAALASAEQLARALMGAGESLAVWWGDHPEEPAELGGLVEGRTWTPADP